MPARKPARGQLRSRNELIAAARRRGARGNSAADWIRADPALLASYDQGRAEFADRLDRRHPLGAGTDDASLGSGGGSPAPTPTSSGPGGSLSLPKLRTPSGDGGGLLLAFVLYPMALAVLKYGPAGLGYWFRAKWLNDNSHTPDKYGQPSAKPGPNDNVPGAPGYHTFPGSPGASGDGSTPKCNGPIVNTPRPPWYTGQWPPPGTCPGPDIGGPV